MPGFESLSITIVIWVALVLAFAGLVQGSLGLGFPMVSTPLIAVVTDIRTAVILVLLPCVATTVTNVVRSGPIMATLRRFWFMPLCMLAGAAVGARLFVAYPAFPFALLLAGVILLYLYLDKRGHAEWAIVPKHPVLFGAGFALLAGMSEEQARSFPRRTVVGDVLTPAQVAAMPRMISTDAHVMEPDALWQELTPRLRDQHMGWAGTTLAI